ncbi:MAG TPA: hypothetical protein VNJ51_09575 [Candidatus Dormibacteraeota bacterium]|nr:hypothetical protein [Candidatus Dormibacteraeota bacterium]
MQNARSAIVTGELAVAELVADVLLKGGYDQPQHSLDVRVAQLSKYAPDLLVIDFVDLWNDPLETIRQIRFVLPDSTIVVLSSRLQQSWAARCHLAGATCVLAKDSKGPQMLAGIRRAVRTGCYTDPRFIEGVGEN